jgi:hypothetical protein
MGTTNIRTAAVAVPDMCIANIPVGTDSAGAEAS